MARRRLQRRQTAELAGLDPDAFLPAYLTSLTGQAELSRRLGRLAEAEAIEQEYVRWAPG
ncbi:hypothetical protein [Streptomyces sp. NPDC001658]